MPRQQFLIVGAPIAPQHREALRELLSSMNAVPGLADPDNALVAFGEFPQLHTARFVMIEDPSLPDRVEHAPAFPVEEPDWLLFQAVCDGSADRLLAELAEKAGEGLAEIFRHCIGFDDAEPIVRWLQRYRLKPDATYRNGPSRSMVQIREEAELHDALANVKANNLEADLGSLAEELRGAGESIPLTPLAKRGPLEWLGNTLSLISLPLIALLLSPILLVLIPALVVMVRLREKNDPVLAPPIDRARNNAILAQEDHDITNAYSAVGSRKQGLEYYLFSKVALWVINWGARHIYKNGRLARVNTIHFASWTFLDNNRRLFFASVYDGSREAYNDDFINKVAFGLNLSFTSALGYPRTRWVIHDGAWHEQDFKRYLSNHQVPTQVWYKAYPDLTAYDLARDARIRKGLERPLKGEALRRWIAEI